MITIKYNNGENGVYNSSGHQLNGSISTDMFGLNPKELLEASLGLCVSITLIKILQRDGVDLVNGELDIEVGSYKTEGAGNRFTELSVSLEFPSLDPSYKRKLKKMIENGCTISNTLKNGANIKIIDSSENE